MATTLSLGFYFIEFLNDSNFELSVVFFFLSDSFLFGD